MVQTRIEQMAEFTTLISCVTIDRNAWLDPEHAHRCSVMHFDEGGNIALRIRLMDASGAAPAKALQ